MFDCLQPHRRSVTIISSRHPKELSYKSIENKTFMSISG